MLKIGKIKYFKKMFCVHFQEHQTNEKVRKEMEMVVFGETLCDLRKCWKMKWFDLTRDH